MESLKAIKYVRGKLDVLDQLRLPHEIYYCNISACEDAVDVIKSMRVRGAPAIAIVAALSLAVELEQKRDSAKTKEDLFSYINSRLDLLVASRPTAVDLYNAASLLKEKCSYTVLNTTSLDACADIRMTYINAAEKILEDDLLTNLGIGKYGAEYLIRQQVPISTPIDEVDQIRCFKASSVSTQGPSDKTYQKLSVLTHCNTGSLATSGHGTALGIIRTLHKMNCLHHTYYTETRPYNQGSRLTSFELIHESIPSTLITDSMVGALFAQKKKQNISAVIVGADRVARNGDTANKIGTYSLAVLARHHGIKFVVAAPTTSIDLRTETGDTIQIEDRNRTELIQITGAPINSDGQVDTTRITRIATADQRANVWNPAFDVTPAELIDAIITERGEIVRDSRGSFDFKTIMSDKWNKEVTWEKPNGKTI